MITFVKEGIYIFYNCESVREKTIVEDSLSFFVEGAQFSDLFRRKEWDGRKKYYNKRDNSFLFGMFNIVKENLIKRGIKFKLKTEDKNLFPLDFSECSFITERGYQKEAIQAFLPVKKGILKVFTQLGKTFIFAELANNFLKKYKEFKILFICDNQDIFLQSIAALKKHIGLKNSQIGQIKGDKITDGLVIFATIQTLDSIFNRKFKNRNYEERRRLKRIQKERQKKALNIFDSINLLVVDECHEFSGDPRINILKKFKNTTYRLALSATPFKEGEKYFLNNLNVKSIFGEVFYEVNEKDGIELGYLKKNKVILLLINHKQNKNLIQGDYRFLVEKVIVQNEIRNSIIVNVIEALRKLKLKTLVLFAYEEHINKIAEITSDNFLTGKTDVFIRQKVKKSFVRGKGKILLATNIFKKGITFPEAEVIVNAAGGKEQSNIIQKKGRVLGITEDKNKALIIDFIDIFDYFSEHSYNRIQAYANNSGEENIIVLDTKDKDFYSDFRGFVKDWFEE